MFLITGSSRPTVIRTESRPVNISMNLNVPRNENLSSVIVKSGNVDTYSSLTNLLDCCILYYYAVAHKYIIMVG